MKRIWPFSLYAELQRSRVEIEVLEQRVKELRMENHRLNAQLTASSLAMVSHSATLMASMDNGSLKERFVN